MTDPHQAHAGPALLALGPVLLQHPELASSLTRRVRDLTVISLSETLWLVVACDSVGAIGPKPADSVRVTAAIAGHFAARVPLVELLAAGSAPFLIVDTLAVERHPTGEGIITAIRDLAAELDLSGPAVVTGSTEENVPTRQTGIGVTALGVCSPESFRPGTARAGDILGVAGLPKSAPDHELVPGDPEIIGLRELRQLASVEGVHDVLPVGSRGIGSEVAEMARGAGLTDQLDEDAPIDLLHSGGPATCVVFSLAPDRWSRVEDAVLSAPLTRIGRLIDASSSMSPGDST